MSRTKMPGSGKIAAAKIDLDADGKLHLLFQDDTFFSSGDLDEYSFSAEPARTLKGLTSAQKVGRLDLNALGNHKRCPPRYLFQAYGPGNGGAFPNGTHKSLNSESAITPHAFHEINESITGHYSVSEIQDPAKMINGHLSIITAIRSELSSWSPSLISNAVYHVPNLIHVSLASRARRTITTQARWGPYLEEYLVHGVVSGAGYVALSYGSIRADLLKVYPEICNNNCWGTNIRGKNFAASFSPVIVTEEQIDLLKGIAQRFEHPELIYPLTVSLICSVKRLDLDFTADQLFNSPNFAFYAKSPNSIIKHMGLTDHWLILEFEFTGYMHEVKHTKTMMRALVRSKY